MVGPRVTGQYIGYLFFVTGNSVNYTYFKMEMDGTLLLQVKILTNSLQKEALRFGYSCGNKYTFISVKVLCIKDPIDLCDHSIFTQ